MGRRIVTPNATPEPFQRKAAGCDIFFVASAVIRRGYPAGGETALMASDQIKRKLAAILAADIAGYSRLMGVDEAGTLARLKEYRRELIDPKTKQYRGRVVKTTGDGILIEFPSVVDAVSDAIDVQQGMRQRNADIPPEKRIEFRIGINLGDVIIDSRDLYGDGVNIAARLEGLAEPGGICISQTVLNHARGKIAFDVEDLGEQHLKNIAQCVHVYSIVVDPARRGTMSRAQAPALAVPDKPSIAVLPFQNMSGDPQQEYFTDGMVEEIITALSRMRWLFVIARNSSFTYKGRMVDVKQVGRELGCGTCSREACARRQIVCASPASSSTPRRACIFGQIVLTVASKTSSTCKTM